MAKANAPQWSAEAYAVKNNRGAVYSVAMGNEGRALLKGTELVYSNPRQQSVESMVIHAGATADYMAKEAQKAHAAWEANGKQGPEPQVPTDAKALEAADRQYRVLQDVTIERNNIANENAEYLSLGELRRITLGQDKRLPGNQEQDTTDAVNAKNQTQVKDLKDAARTLADGFYNLAMIQGTEFEIGKMDLGNLTQSLASDL